MTHFLIVENDRLVDVVFSPETAESRARNGWRIVLDCAGDDWRAVREKAHAYAHQHRKKCRAPEPLSDEELAERLHQVYTRLLGEELINAIAQLYAHDPAQAIAFFKDTLREKAGAPSTTEETTEQPAPTAKKKSRRKKRE